MNTGELELSFRRAFQDTESDYFVTSDEFRSYLNEAEEEACRRSRLLVATDLSTGETKAQSTITITGDSGSITSILVDNINILTNVIAFTGSAFTTAALLSNDINSTGLYTASVSNTTITINPLEGVGADLNNIAPIITGTLLNTFTSFIGGVDGICKIKTKANKSVYELSTRILKTNAFYYGETLKKLDIIDYREMDECKQNWQASKGEPMAVIVGLNSSKINLYKVPLVSSTILMNVVHLPLKKMLYDEDIPSIPEHYHEKLIYWCLFKAYSKNDSETQNGTASNYFKGLFANEFGEDLSTTAFYEQSRKVFVDNGHGDY